MTSNFLLHDETCQRCLGEGYIITCIDDLCASSDRCIHGDGESPCPECNGNGFVWVDNDMEDIE